MVDAKDVNFDAANLPPAQSVGVDIINTNLDNFERFEQIASSTIKPIGYKPHFKLDYLANTGVGASVGGRFGSGISGGVQGIFSDILGRNQIYTTVAINGQIYDFGGQFAYMNQDSRINWGAGISHIPYITGYQNFERIGNGGAYARNNDIIRTFEERAQVFGSYPFSKVHRFELGGSLAYYSYRIERQQSIFTPGQFAEFYPYKKISKEEASDSYGFPFNNLKVGGLDFAFVGDNSYFGITSPLSGFRYRIGASQQAGDYRYGSVLTDVRKYARFKPLTFAARIYTNTTFGRDQDQYYSQQFIGYPTLIRGYEYQSFNKIGDANTAGFNLYQLVGSKVAVANFEIRLPFTGPEKLAAIESGFLLSDLNLFFDIGLAYDNNSKVAFKSTPGGIGLMDDPFFVKDPLKPNELAPQVPRYYERVPAMSAGVSLRVNVFGYFIIEPYLAIPFQRKDVKGGVIGVNLAPGW